MTYHGQNKPNGVSMFSYSYHLPAKLRGGSVFLFTGWGWVGMHGSRSLGGRGVMPGARSVLDRGGYVWSQVPSEGRWIRLVPGPFLNLGKPGK